MTVAHVYIIKYKLYIDKYSRETKLHVIGLGNSQMTLHRRRILCHTVDGNGININSGVKLLTAASE